MFDIYLNLWLGKYFEMDDNIVIVCLFDCFFSYNIWCVSILRWINKKEFVSFYEVL